MTGPTTPPVLIFAIIDLPAGQEDEALRAVNCLTEASQAEAGCISYRVLRSIRLPTRLIIQEEWLDSRAVEIHRNSGHVTEFRRFAIASGATVWASGFQIAE